MTDGERNRKVEGGKEKRKGNRQRRRRCSTLQPSQTQIVGATVAKVGEKCGGRLKKGSTWNLQKVRDECKL